MILIADLNPIETKEYSLPTIFLNKLNKADRITSKINGEGIIAAEFLNVMNAENQMMSFCGKKENYFMEKLLKEKGIDYKGILIWDCLMEAAQFKSEDSQLFVLGPNSKITQGEIENFYSEFTEKSKASEMVIIVNGKIHNGLDDFSENLIRICYKNGTKVVVCSENDEIGDIVKAKPYLAVLDISQLENIVNLKLQFEWEIIKAIDSLLDTGVGGVAVIDSFNKFIYKDKKEGIRIRFDTVPNNYKQIRKADLAAGLCLGYLKKYDIKMTCKIAVAAGFVGYGTDELIDSSKVKQLMNVFEVESFNV